MPIAEINGRFACTDCGYIWSAMAGDDEVPSQCSCQEPGYQSIDLSMFNPRILDLLRTTTYEETTEEMVAKINAALATKPTT